MPCLYNDGCSNQYDAPGLTLPDGNISFRKPFSVNLSEGASYYACVGPF